MLNHSKQPSPTTSTINKSNYNSASPLTGLSTLANTDQRSSTTDRVALCPGTQPLILQPLSNFRCNNQPSAPLFLFRYNHTTCP